MRWTEREADDQAAEDAQAEREYAAQRQALGAREKGPGLMSAGEMESRWQRAWDDAVARGGRQGGIEAGG